jgi:D-alanyl-D-alanine carboxypeptidase/D-alanyl-D-alanine-endopeptidase (penicillin-binding protein 4)
MRNHKRRHCLPALLWGWLLLPALALADLPAPVAQALRAAGLPPDSAAVFVQQVDKAKPLISHHAEQAVSPASTMKLVTTYAALGVLGPAYTWRTEIYSAAPQQGDVLNGDLILKGYGDPALTLENFWDLLRALRKSGVREIKGDLVLDRGYFDTAPHDPGQFDGEPYRAYNAGPDALLVNFKATRFSFRGEVQQGKVAITTDPELPQLKVINQIELRQVPCADWKDRLGYRVQREGESVTAVFSGNYSVACGEKSLELSLFDDAVYVHQLFRQLWQEQGGVLRGALKLGTVPEGAKRLAQANSPPLADVIRLVNKYSNNVMARQLLLTMGAESGIAPGSAENGGQAVHDWLAKQGLDFPELVIENGAGLSRNERISARHLGELLLAAWRSPLMPELMSSLPLAAVDGTLQHRLNGSAVAGQAHVKTGSLEGARAIAGYLLDAKGRRWVVVFVVNHPRAAAAGAAQDALLEWLHDRQ